MERVIGRPADCTERSEREVKCYDLLDELGIPYERVDHPVVNTMEACEEIDRVLGAFVCKNLFLCNRQQTQFYLVMLPGEKQLRTKDLSRQLGVSRLSFADAEHMRALLGLEPGSVSVLGLMNDTGHQVQLVMDAPVLESDTFGCHPCQNTSSLRIRTRDLLEKFLPAVGHAPIRVEL